MLANTDPRFCDCNRIVDADAIPLGTDQPNKQQEISLKADWKYVAVASFEMNKLLAANQQHAIGAIAAYIPSQYLQEVFRPPQA